jgi:hypothetical protein
VGLQQLVRSDVAQFQGRVPEPSTRKDGLIALPAQKPRKPRSGGITRPSIEKLKMLPSRTDWQGILLFPLLLVVVAATVASLQQCGRMFNIDPKLPPTIYKHRN